MATLSINDTIFATVSSGSDTLLNRSLSGASTVNEVIKLICRELAGHIGVVTVYLRNISQGWIERRVVRLSAAINRATSAPRQLPLF